MAQYLATLTDTLTLSGGIEVSRIEGRIKDKAECVRKFSRKYRTSLEESNTPYTIATYISDLIGVRVVCLYEDDIDAITQTVGQHFDVIEVTNKTAAVEGTESAPENAVSDDEGNVKVTVSVCELEKCERCWKRTPDVDSDPAHSHVCARCAHVLAETGEAGE